MHLSLKHIFITVPHKVTVVLGDSAVIHHPFDGECLEPVRDSVGSVRDRVTV